MLELLVVLSLEQLPGIISSFLDRGTEERKQFKELVVKAAIESWKTHGELAGNRSSLFPLEHYIIHMAMMCEFTLADEKLTPGSMKQHLQELSAVMSVLEEHAQSPRTK